MFKILTWSVRHTVLVIVLLALVPTCAITVYSGYTRSEHLTRDAENHLIHLAESIASQEELVVNSSIDVMNTIVKSAALKHRSKEEIVLLFKALVSDSGFIDVILATPSGEIIASAHNKPIRAQEKKLISTVVQQNKFSIGDFLIQEEHGTAGLYSAMPVHDEQGQISMVLLSCTPITSPAQRIIENMPPHAQLRYADRYGRTIIANTSTNEYTSYNLLDASELALLRNRQTNSGTYRLVIQNSLHMVVFQRLSLNNDPQPYLYVLLDVPQDVLTSGASSMIVRDLGLLFVGAVLALIIAWLLSTRVLLRPLKLLINTASRFGHGELGARADIENFGGEFKSLAHSFNHMAVALEIRNQQLVESKKAADSGNKAKSAFLANMSHEIRTPMNAIIGLAYLALQTDLNPKQQGYINKIYSSANSLLRIINDILDFSKVEAGKIKLEDIPFELDTIFDNIADMLIPQAQKKGLELEFRVSQHVPPTLKGDPLRLGQILINLVTNAIKFTTEGKISLTCDVKEFQDDYARLVFAVKDTGIGMSEEALAKLFKAFSQADDSTTRRFGGTGLGLVISKHLAELMQGDIFITSEEGKGTTVEVQLTLGLVDESTQQYSESHRELSGVPVLIVDDDENSRTTLVEMLKRLSLRPKAVDSGEKALREIESMDLSNPYQVVLMDWKLPGMNGSETTKKIKELNLPQAPVVIMVTAYGRSEIFHYATSSGVDGFLHKPVTPSLLYNTIQDSLALRDGKILTPKENTKPNDDCDLSGKRILVVEDNQINQQVASELLTSKNAEVAMADNGKEALDMLLATKDGKIPPYDLVLMDLQMPVMDGLEATYNIRADSAFDNLPIIAMTAHAMQEEHDSCKEAGMNDHIAKPIDVNALYRTLNHWLNREESPPQPFRPGQPEKKPEFDPNSSHELRELRWSSATNDHQDNSCTPVEADLVEALPFFNVKTALTRVAGNTELYKKMLSRFAKEYANKDAELSSMLKNDKKEDAILIAHSIKGLSGNLGMLGLFDAARKLEDSLRSDMSCTDIEVQSQLTAFSMTLQQSLNQINLFMETAGKTENKPVVSESVPLDPKKLASLREALYESDAKSQELFYELEQELQNLIPEGKLGILRENIENFEFDEAYELLETLLPDEPKS